MRKEHADNDDPVPAVVPPGPDNPLGKYKFTLGWPEYLIHGTNKPYGVGLRSSHGCIRLYPEDIEMMYKAVPLGTPVRVVNQPFLFGWHDGRLYLQAYTVFEDDTRNWSKAQKSLLIEVDDAAAGKAAQGGGHRDRLGCGRAGGQGAARPRGAGERRGRHGRGGAGRRAAGAEPNTRWVQLGRCRRSGRHAQSFQQLQSEREPQSGDHRPCCPAQTRRLQPLPSGAAAADAARRRPSSACPRR